MSDTVNVDDFPPGLLGVPVEEWMWTETAWALQELVLPAGSRPVWHGGGATIAAKRNKLVRTLLEDDQAEWLLMVDSDQVPPPVTALQLLSVGEDIVSALVFSEVPPHSACCGFESEDGGSRRLEEIRPREDPIREVDWAGTGCLLIRRHVFEAMEEPWFEALSKSGTGSDTYFCRRAREAGFKIHVDTRLEVGHVGATSVDAAYVRAWRRTEAGRNVADGYSQERGWDMVANRPR